MVLVQLSPKFGFILILLSFSNLCLNFVSPQEILLRQLINTRPNYFYTQTTSTTTANPLYNKRKNGGKRELIKLVRRNKNQFEFSPQTIAYAAPVPVASAVAGRSLTSQAGTSPWTVAKRGANALFHNFPKPTIAVVAPRAPAVAVTTTRAPQTFVTVSANMPHAQSFFESQKVNTSMTSKEQQWNRPAKTLNFPKRNFMPKFPNHVKHYLSTSTTTTSATTTEEATTTTEEPTTTATTARIELPDNDERENVRITSVVRRKVLRPVYRRRRPGVNGSGSGESMSVESGEIGQRRSHDDQNGSGREVNTVASLPLNASSNRASLKPPLMSSEETTEIQITPDKSASNTEYVIITNGAANGFQGGRSIIDPNNGKVSVRSHHYHDYHPGHHSSAQDNHSHYYHHPHSHANKKVQPGYDTSSIIPLDKTLVYVGMITSWLFWIIVFTWYYFWNNKSLLDSSAPLHRTGESQSKSDSSNGQEDLTRRVILSINDFAEQHQQNQQQPQMQAVQTQPVQQAQFTLIPQPQVQLQPFQQQIPQQQFQQVQLGQIQPHLQPQPHFIQAR